MQQWLQKWFRLAFIENPRTTAAGVAAIATGAKLITMGELLEGFSAVVVGIGLVVSPDANRVKQKNDQQR